MTKKITLVLLMTLCLAPSVFAQKFTKREQARREAREANYFCGATFTFFGGYTHSWMTEEPLDITATYGKSEYWNNTDNSYTLGFAWDQAFSRRWGIQTGLYLNNKGGDHLHYYDGGTSGNYGPILRPEETDEVTVHSIELQCQGRFFLPLGKYSRISLNAGLFIDKHFDTPSGIGNWNIGPQAGIGFDWKHISTCVTYQPGLSTKVTDQSDSRLNGISVNLGYRIWKK